MLNETEPGEARWKYETRTWIRSSPTTSSGTVFVGNSGGQVHAIDLLTGQNRWEATLPNGSIEASPAIDADHVYVGNNAGYFAALDRATGDEVWSVSVDGRYTLGRLTSSPLLYQETVYVGMHDGKLYAIDAASGEMQWAFQTGSQIETSPITADGTICIASGNDLYAISAGDGQEQWVVTEPSEPVRTPTEHDGTVYFGSKGGTVYAVDGTDGTVKWTNSDYYRLDSTPTVYEDSLYIGLSGGPDGIANIDTDTGEEQWVSGTGNVFSSPTVAGGTVFFCTELGIIYAVDLGSEEYTWTFRSESEERIRSSPTVAGGVLYVGSDDGSLYAIDTGTDASSAGSRTTDRSFGYHTQTETVAQQERSTDGQQEDQTAVAGGPNSSSSGGENEGLSPWVLGAGGSTVALMGYLLGKKALSRDSNSSESDTDSAGEDTFELDEPDT